MSIKNVEFINPKHLILDAGTQSRTTINKELIEDYSELFKSVKAGETPESRYPFTSEIEVIRTPEGKLIVWDGFHRTLSAIESKVKEVAVNIKDGSVEDAILLSCGANEEHGLKRSRKDKQRAVKTLLGNPVWKDWNNSEIARHAKVSEGLVRSVRSVAQTPSKSKVKHGGKVREVSKRGSKKDGKAAAPATPAKLNDDEVARAITRIGHIVGGKDGKAIKEGIETGSIAISPKELAVFAGAPESTIKKIAPLVAECGYKPSKAIEFLDAPLTPETTIKELKLLAVANGGKITEIVDGAKVSIVVE